MNAKTKAQYIKAWHNHVAELINVGFEADNIAEYDRLAAELDKLIVAAADKVFPDA